MELNNKRTAAPGLMQRLLCSGMNVGDYCSYFCKKQWYVIMPWIAKVVSAMIIVFKWFKKSKSFIKPKTQLVGSTILKLFMLQMFYKWRNKQHSYRTGNFYEKTSGGYLLPLQYEQMAFILVGLTFERSTQYINAM